MTVGEPAMACGGASRDGSENQNQYWHPAVTCGGASRDSWGASRDGWMRGRILLFNCFVLVWDCFIIAFGLPELVSILLFSLVSYAYY